MESIVLKVYPAYKGSLLILDLDYLRLPEDIDWGSIKTKDNKGRKILSDLIFTKGSGNKLSYKSKIKENKIIFIIDNEDVNEIRVFYSRKKAKKGYKHPRKTIFLKNEKKFEISTKKTRITFEKKYYSIENFSIEGNSYGNLQLITFGGELTKQNGNFIDLRFDLISDSPMLKIFRVSGKMPVRGNEVKNTGYLPFEMDYFFWSHDNDNIYSKVEMKLLYEKSHDEHGKKLSYLKSNIWYKNEGVNKVYYNGLFVNQMDKSKIITLRRPYYACVKKSKNMFLMSPFLSLPNDGIHIEVDDKGFGASWHSLSKGKKSYWNYIFKGESTGKSQGFYPAHSLNAYWNIGLFFGNGNDKLIANSFTYPIKVQYLYQEKKEISNPYIAHWKDNKKIAINIITDDAKINDYLWRKNNILPSKAQVALSTRKKLGIRYTRYCFIGDKIISLGSFGRLSTLFCSILSNLGIAEASERRFVKDNLSLIPHTNSHPVIWKSNANKVYNEIKTAERIWVENFKLKKPLSHVFSFPTPYGLETKKGTRESVAFTASKYLQWIREWPIPNAPTDFFLPTRLFWGISSGGDLFEEKTSEKIRSDFKELNNNGADYMQISGHLPDKVDKQYPRYVKDVFDNLEKNENVWIASADEIIRYYKNREDVMLGRIQKEESYNILELKNDLGSIMLSELTFVQRIKGKLNIEQSIDKKTWKNVEYKHLDKKKYLVMYSVDKGTRFLRFR